MRAVGVLVAGAATVALVFAAGACSSSADVASTSTSGTASPPATIGKLEFRPVLAVLPPSTPIGPDVLLEVDADDTPVLAYQLGPGFEAAIVSAEPMQSLNGGGRWDIDVDMAPGASGIDAFNDGARSCHALDATCPTGQLAVILGGQVVSAPRIAPQQATFTPFTADELTIGGDLDRAAAEDFVAKLRAG